MVKLKYMTSVLLLILCWELISRLGVVPNTLLPPFSDVVRLYTNPNFAQTLLTNYAISLMRSLMGFTIGLVAGISLAVILSFKSIHEFIHPIATLFFAVSSVAWIPLLIVWVGVDELKLPLLSAFLCTFPPILYGMMNTLRTMDKEQVDVALVLGAKPSAVLARIIIPQAILRIIPQIKVEAIMSWKTVFVTEMVALSSGLGYLALIYATSIDMGRLLSVIMLFTLSVLIIVELFDHIEKALSSKWLGEETWYR